MTPTPQRHDDPEDTLSTAIEVGKLTAQFQALSRTVELFIERVEPMLIENSGTQERLKFLTDSADSAKLNISNLKAEVAALRNRQNVWLATVTGGIAVLQFFGFLFFTDAGQVLFKRLLGFN